jgi:hypothetical protein
MKHLRVPGMSTNSTNNLFTAPGLGDRVHLLSIGYLYSLEIQDLVSLHFTGAQGQNRNRDSFMEILELFPEQRLNLVFHDFIPRDEKDWSEFFAKAEIDAPSFHYGDHPGRFEKLYGIDASKLLLKLPCLGTDEDLNLQGQKYITAQWDSTAPSRKIPESVRLIIEESYKNLGYGVVIIGGEADSPALKSDLMCISEVLKGASLHVGVDSGFMHLARLYLPPSRLEFYNGPHGYWSHHALRLRDIGVQVNRFYIKLNIFHKIRIKMLYDSPRLYRIMVKSSKVSSLIMKNSWFTKNIRAKGHLS